VPRPANPTLRRDLLENAARLLDARGEPSFSMKELCAGIDYSVTAAYRVFRGRSHLLRALQLHLFEGLFADLAAAPQDCVIAETRALGRRFLCWAVSHPARYRFMFHSTEAEALLDPADQALARAPLAYLEAILARGQAEGVLSIEDPGATALLLFGSLHGLASLQLAERLDRERVPDLVAFYDRWADTWLAVLTPTGPVV
jgi:AcrR family transcriptional regulator